MILNRRAAWLSLLLVAVPLHARLTHFVVDQQHQGKAQTLAGHFIGELDPKDPHNSIVTDIEFAPRNAHGMVEYSATFAISIPSKLSGVLFYTVPNRGSGAPADSEEGHVSVVSGWQGDLIPRTGLQTIAVPVAHNQDGSPLTGPVITRFINTPPNTNTLELGKATFAALSYQRPLTLDTKNASLTKHDSPADPGHQLASGDWAFADCTKVPFPGTPDPSRICAKQSFDPAVAYDLVFIAKDPLVLGIGYAATRDLNSFLRYADKDDVGTPNPLAKQIKWAIARGNSQSGTFIRSFIRLGFNQDESNRIVWDGVNPHIAARQMALNFRFAPPGGNAGLYEPGSEGVQWWSDYTDTTRHRPSAGLLDRCEASGTCPKILETFGGLEFWYLRESLDLVGTDAKADIPLPSNVRRYFFPGTTHGGGRGGFSVDSTPINACVLPANPNPEADTLRALVVTLVDWVTKGAEPPPSRYPRIDRGELVPPTKAAMNFPNIPGVPIPAINTLFDYDFGPAFKYVDLSGVIAKPQPALKGTVPMLVPKSDADGSDVGGVPSVLHQAPLGTYVGWNVMAGGFNKGQACALNGGYIPFARTKSERTKAHDPRLSLEERYGNHAGYIAAVKAAADTAVRDRFLLPDDAARLIAQATNSQVLQ